MTKFKPGQRVFHVTQGVVTLEKHPDGRNEYPLWVDELCCGFTEDGLSGELDIYPSLYTLEKAREMGFPVPKEPLRVEVEVKWREEGGGVFPVEISAKGFWWEDLIGKTGTLVFTESEET